MRGKAKGKQKRADEPEEDVADVLADVGAQAEELAVHAVQNGLQEVALSRVLRVEQVEQLQHMYGYEYR